MYDHDSNSSDLALSANLDDLTYTSLNIVDQSTEVHVIPTPVHEVDDFIDDADDDTDNDVDDDSDSDDLESDNECEAIYCSSDEADWSINVICKKT